VKNSYNPNHISLGFILQIPFNFGKWDIKKKKGQNKIKTNTSGVCRLLPGCRLQYKAGRVIPNNLKWNAAQVKYRWKLPVCQGEGITLPRKRKTARGCQRMGKILKQ
jgi:hypothetical protein